MKTQKPYRQKRTSTFRSIKAKLTFSFSITTLLIGLMIGLFFWFDTEVKELKKVTDTLQQINYKLQQANSLEKEFFIVETINLQFYLQGQSDFIFLHKKLLQEVKNDLETLQDESLLQDVGVQTEIQALQEILKNFESVFESLVRIMLKRGFKDFGIEGQMREAIRGLETSAFNVDMVTLLTLRRHEKDYFLRKDPIYIQLLDEKITVFGAKIKEKIPTNDGQAYVMGILEKYQNSFHEIVALEQQIGFQGQGGLKNELQGESKKIEDKISSIEAMVRQEAAQANQQIEIAVVVLFVVFIIINFLLSYFTTRSLSEPMTKLSESLHQVVESNFNGKAKIYESFRRDEIGTLSQDMAFMLSKMKERNAQIISQKEQLRLAFDDIQLLGKVGQDITAQLNTEEIIKVMRHNLKRLTGANTFWLGLHDTERDVLVYRGAEPMLESARPTQSLNEVNKLSIQSFKRQQMIVLDQISEQERKNEEYLEPIIPTKHTSAIVCVPLASKSVQWGVLMLHFENLNHITKYQKNIIQNLAVYMVVALENASIYEHLEEKVNERTVELVEKNEEIETQKEKIQKAFHDIKQLSEIGQTITGSLAADVIVEQVYQNINQIMDAAVFGIGIYRPENETIRFIGAIENHEKVPMYSYELQDRNSYASWCFRNDQEILTNDVAKDSTQYGLEQSTHIETEQGRPQSLMYLPIKLQDKKLGVLAVQSFEKNAYNHQHLNLLRNLAVYIGIALENAETYYQMELQNIAIDKSNKKIKASINYAKRIQQALLPDMNAIQKQFEESFILYKPRDIVSGDFYWFVKKESKLILAALDCTGHGVPGALMSMIGNELLNEIVNLRGVLEPHHILEEMHKGVRKDLKQYENNNRDGMDMSVVVIDKNQKTLDFAGANLPLLYIQNEEMHVVKGDKLPIGGHQREMKRTFNTHRISTQIPTTFYLYSDGYQDQFGGRQNRKFGGKRLRNLIHTIHFLDMKEQKQVLNTTINRWMLEQSNTKQIDDMLVMGFVV